jgi:DNA-binding response OmpR family regulator
MLNKQKTVLVVDDDEDILKFLDKILSAAGFSVMVADSPQVAREMMIENPPHLVISDLNMEPEHGYSFIQSLRRQKQFVSLPVIVLSAVNEFSTVKNVIALGISDYCIKPIQPPMLLRKIRKALHNNEFSSWVLPAGKEIEMDVVIDAHVTEMGETGYRIAGPFKIHASKKVKINLPEFKEMGLHKYIHQASNLMKTFSGGGVFSNDITFMAINEEGASKIRQFVKKSTQNE